MRRPGAAILEILISLVVIGLLVSGAQLARHQRQQETAAVIVRACRSRAIRVRERFTRVVDGALVTCRPDGALRSNGALPSEARIKR